MGWVQGPKKVDQDSAAAPQFYMPINGEEICFKASIPLFTFITKVLLTVIQSVVIHTANIYIHMYVVHLQNCGPHGYCKVEIEERKYILIQKSMQGPR